MTSLNTGGVRLPYDHNYVIYMGFRVAGFEFAPHYLTSKLGSVMSTVKCVDALFALRIKWRVE